MNAEGGVSFESNGIKWESQTMDDGEVWYHARLEGLPEDSLFPNGSVVVVTAEGRSLIEANPYLFKKILVYKRASDERRQAPHVRDFIDGQGNGAVYALGNTNLAVKEASTSQSVHSQVERMDLLYRIIENAVMNGTLPEWIILPKHYGYITPPKEATNNKQFLLLEQIGRGVTVEQMLTAEERGELEKVEERFGSSISKDDIRLLEEQWFLLKQLLEEAVRLDNALRPPEERRSMKQILPDLHAGNVLVERMPETVGGKPFRLWIIDQ